MRRAGSGGACCDSDRGIDVESYRREADFVAARLVAQFERDVLCAQRGVGLRGERQAEDDLVRVDVKWSFGEGEGAKFALGVGDLAGRLEAGGQIGAEIGGNEVLGGRLAGVDVKAGTDFEHDGELEGAAARDRFQRSVGGGSDHFAAGRDLWLRGRQRGDDDQQKGGNDDGGRRLHRRTC